MEPDVPHGDLASEVRGLVAEYVRTRSWAREAQARGYHSLLASADAAAYARQLCSRAVQACEEAALIFEGVDEARDVRRRILRLSKTLASLVGDTTAADAARRARRTAFRNQHPALGLLLEELDRAPSGQGGETLHERILSVAGAATAALDARQQAAR